MATQTDTNIASVADLISAFVAFAVANAGFTDNGTDTYDGETLYKISRTTNSVLTYWGFVYEPVTSASHGDEAISARMMLVNPTGANFETVADGQRIKTRLGLYHFTAPFTGYKFYSDGTNVFAAIEVRANIFTHLAIGNITKCGTYDGGEFLQADYHETSSTVFHDINRSIGGGTDNATYVFAPRRTAPTSVNLAGRNYIRYNTGGGDNTDFFPMGREDNTDNLVSGSATLSPPFALNEIGTGTVSVTPTSSSAIFDPFGKIILYSPSTTTNVAPIMPVYVTRTDFAIEQQRIIGYVPNIGSISMGNLNPKDIVNTDWDVYPRTQKTGDDTEATISGDWGIAYRVT